MKESIFIVLISVLFTVTVSAQLPDSVKSSLITLTAKVDQLTDTEEIRKEIVPFVFNAPDQASQLSALRFIKETSKSLKVKEAIAEYITALKEHIGSSYVVLKNATIINAVSDIGKKGNIIIKGDKIEAVDYTGTLEIPEGAKIYDLTGKYIIPGLIDAHVHITHGTLKEAQEHLHIALKSGVTGVRDMGGDGRMLALLKKNMQIGEDVGPDVFFSTLIAGPEFFKNDPRPQQVAKGAKAGQVSWQRAVTDSTDFRQVIAEAKGLGATAIKIYDNVDEQVFKKVADEAKYQGLKVWSHAVVPPTKALDVTNAGSDAVSHIGDMVQYEFEEGNIKGRHEFKSTEERKAYHEKLNTVSWDKNSIKVKQLFNAVKANNTIIDATLFVYTFGLTRPINGQKIDSTEYKIAMKATKIAYNMGVKIGAGSDHMISLDDNTINIHSEMELLTKAGLSNIDAIRAATIINAEILGEEDNIGTIQIGKVANMVVLNANPLKKISNTKAIDFVVKRGKVIREKHTM
ncbi:amidohydrolase family protein [Flagellimonas onchidii]|uniref:amidohydrolase family protein n=1 Tax=Flagellimonas onchidii TaxID=2562684 RepID=UPI0010A65F94|nr:amidohydrolase family protein [Allomuricauda onchidii]